MKITAIYDNGGRSFDRYTIVTDGTFSRFSECLSLSENPNDPQGMSQWGGCTPGYHLGKLTRFEKLSTEIQRHIALRVLSGDAEPTLGEFDLV